MNPRIGNAPLFAVCVLVWSTTWYAITWQVDRVAPEVGVALRFALAGGVVLAMTALRGQSLRFPAAAHAGFALQGAFLYGVSYVCVYHAERRVPSGLVAVGYSASPLLSGLGARWLHGTPLARGFVPGGLLGVAGVALIFWPELGAAGTQPQAGLRLAFTAAAVLLSAAGNLVASRNGAAGLGLAFWPALGWAMLYGAALSSLSLAGQPIAWPSAPSWWASLAYLSVAGSVLAFGAYLTLQQRLGLGRAATVGVMTPVVALAVSTAFEGYRPGLFTLAGAVLAIAGNRLMLTERR